MTTETLITAIDNYSKAHEARQCCPPEKQELLDKLAESSHRKVCQAMGVLLRERADDE